MRRTKSGNAHLASEFYVASQLSRLGYKVTVEFGPMKEADLTIGHPDGRTVTIDVKGLKNTTNWPLNARRKNRGHFYVLVSYRNKFDNLQSQPDIFVVPSLKVKKILLPWSGRPDVKCVGYHQIKNSMYQDAWHLLFK